jgi:hypothetical protein
MRGKNNNEEGSGNPSSGNSKSSSVRKKMKNSQILNGLSDQKNAYSNSFKEPGLYTERSSNKKKEFFQQQSSNDSIKGVYNS